MLVSYLQEERNLYPPLQALVERKAVKINRYLLQTDTCLDIIKVLPSLASSFMLLLLLEYHPKSPARERVRVN